MFRDICPETSGMNYHFTLHNIPEEWRSHLLRNGGLKSVRHCFPSTTRSLKMCLHRKGCCSGNNLHFLSIDMFFQTGENIRESFTQFSRIFRHFREMFCPSKLSSCTKLWLQCFLRMSAGTSSILSTYFVIFFQSPPNICAIAPHYTMMASFQILSSSSFIRLCNIQWYIIWEL